METGDRRLARGDWREVTEDPAEAEKILSHVWSVTRTRTMWRVTGYTIGEYSTALQGVGIALDLGSRQDWGHHSTDSFTGRGQSHGFYNRDGAMIPGISCERLKKFGFIHRK